MTDIVNVADMKPKSTNLVYFFVVRGNQLRCVTTYSAV